MKHANTASKFDWRVVDLAWRMGYTIALPIVLLALGGRLLDKRFNTSPIFLLAGILLSIILSTLGILKIILPILNDMGKPEAPKSTSENPSHNDINPKDPKNA